MVLFGYPGGNVTYETLCANYSHFWVDSTDGHVTVNE